MADRPSILPYYGYKYQCCYYIWDHAGIHVRTGSVTNTLHNEAPLVSIIQLLWRQRETRLALTVGLGRDGRCSSGVRSSLLSGAADTTS